MLSLLFSLLLKAHIEPSLEAYFPTSTFSTPLGAAQAGFIKNHGLSLQLRTQKVPHSLWRGSLSFEKFIHLQWTYKLAFSHWRAGWSFNSGWYLGIEKPCALSPGTDLLPLQLQALNPSFWKPTPQPKREPTCQGSLQVEGHQDFVAEIGLSDAGLEGFLYPDLDSSCNTQAAFSLSELPLVQAEIESMSPEEDAQPSLALILKFATPEKLYVHLCRPLQQSGVNVDFKPLNLDSSSAMACLRLGLQTFLEIETLLNNLSALANPCQTPLLEQLSQVELSLPKCFYSQERFYAVPKARFVKQLQESFGLIAYTRLAEGMLLTLPNPCIPAQPFIWGQVLHWLESTSWLSLKEDDKPAHEGFKAFRYLKTITLSFAENLAGLPTLAGLKLSLSNRYLEQGELLEIPLEMPYYRKHDYERDKGEDWPPYEVTRASMQPYEDLRWLQEKLPHLVYNDTDEGKFVAIKTADLGLALGCQHASGLYLIWEGALQDKTFRCPYCQALWSPRKYPEIHYNTFEKIRTFVSRKQECFSTKDLYTAYVQNKKIKFSQLIHGQRYLQLYPKVVQALARLMEGELVDDCDILNPSFKIAFTLEASNNIVEAYKGKEFKKTMELVKKLLMEIEGVSIEEAEEKKTALMKVLQEGRSLTFRESMHQKAMLAVGKADPFAQQAQRSMDAREVNLHRNLVIEQALVRAAVEEAANCGNTALVRSGKTQKAFLLLDKLPGNQPLEALLLGVDKPILFGVPTTEPLPILAANGTLKQLALESELISEDSTSFLPNSSGMQALTSPAPHNKSCVEKNLQKSDKRSIALILGGTVSVVGLGWLYFSRRAVKSKVTEPTKKDAYSLP